jgi:hypothetical protein
VLFTRVVDEAQDMSTYAFRLLRKIVPEGSNDLFLVGDDFPALDMVGTLRVREPDGTWLELEHDVDRVLWPSTGVRPSTEPTEAREIVYLALTGDRRVVRRTVLP